MAEARSHYIQQQQPQEQLEHNQVTTRSFAAVLMVVSAGEANVYDQRAVTMSVLARHPDIPYLTATFDDLKAGRMKLDTNRRLFV